jgi:hypothetical protein
MKRFFTIAVLLLSACSFDSAPREGDDAGDGKDTSRLLRDGAGELERDAAAAPDAGELERDAAAAPDAGELERDAAATLDAGDDAGELERDAAAAPDAGDGSVGAAGATAGSSGAAGAGGGGGDACWPWPCFPGGAGGG